MVFDYKRGWLKRSGEKSDKIILYRFFSYNANSLGPLTCGGLYFSSPTKFNDPFDCDFRMLPTSLEKNYGISWDAAVEESKTNVQKMGIICFTSHWKNTLMWAHYADKFKGFCLGFEFKNPLHEGCKIENSFATFRKHPYRISEYHLDEVLYACQDEYPTASSFHFDEIEKEMPESILRYKASDWQYEHECRLSYCGGEGVHPVPGKIREVYFGLRMENEQKNVLFDIIKKWKPHFYETRKSELRFEVERILFSNK